MGVISLSLKKYICRLNEPVNRLFKDIWHVERTGRGVRDFIGVVSIGSAQHNIELQSICLEGINSKG